MKKEILRRLYQTTRGRKISEEYKNICKELGEMEKEFLKKVGEDRLEELEQITDKVHEMDDILSFDDFCNGFSMAVRLFLIETIYKERDDQE